MLHRTYSIKIDISDGTLFTSDILEKKERQEFMLNLIIVKKN